MADFPSAWQEIRKSFALPLSTLREIAVKFREEMEKGLAGKKSSLKMLPSYLGKPAGDEKGSFLALDFGGTNVRVMLVELLGQGKHNIVKRLAFLLKDEQEGYDYTSSAVDGEELFRFISRKIKQVAGEDKVYRLGHTFSYPCRNEGINSALLLKWTKEIKTAGAEGKDIAQLLQRALGMENIKNIIPCAILNDTVATLLAGAYQEKDCDIGTILGTGHNTCYLEANPPGQQKPMIINLEAGNFNLLPLTKYDRLLDKEAEKPGEQLLEKMVSGKYLGELVRLVLLDLYDKDRHALSGDMQQLLIKGAFTAADMSSVLTDRNDNTYNINISNSGNDCSNNCCSNMGNYNCSSINTIENPWEVLAAVCRLVRNRSAHLAAATYAGILLHLDPALEHRHVIAVDGSLYEKMPGYAQELKLALRNILGEKNHRVDFRPTKDGSGIGAAIAAAMSGRNSGPYSYQ